jgi:gluconolactonase
MTTLADVLESSELQKVASGFLFTEGPLWHPDGFFYFVDLPSNLLYRMVPGQQPEKVRDTQGGNGTTFDLQGRLLNCEGDARRVARIEQDGTVTTLADRFKGKRLSRPNDVICHSNGSILFTDPDFRVPLEDREIGHAAVYRVAPDGAVSEVVRCEYPNGLALSRDERTLFVANTRWTQYIHAVELDSSGHMVRRRVFADMSADGTNGVPDGMKIDEAGRVFCTGTGFCGCSTRTAHASESSKRRRYARTSALAVPICGPYCSLQRPRFILYGRRCPDCRTPGTRLKRRNSFILSPRVSA